MRIIMRQWLKEDKAGGFRDLHMAREPLAWTWQ